MTKAFFGQQCKNPAAKEILSTGDIAKLCHVSTVAVCKWIDSGKLQGYRIPLCDDRRVSRENLIRFLKENRFPLGDMEQPIENVSAKVKVAKMTADILTSGDVAKICYVSPRTVSKWIDGGILPGYRLPGSNNRRVCRGDLIAFLDKYGMPSDLSSPSRSQQHKVLLAGTEAMLLTHWQECLFNDPRFGYRVAETVFECGVVAERFQPHTIVVDMSLGRSATATIPSGFTRQRKLDKPLTIALANEDDEDVEGLYAYGWDVVVQKPFDVALLCEQIRTFALDNGIVPVEEKR